MPTPALQIGPATADTVARALALAWQHIPQPARDHQITRMLAQWRVEPDPTAILLVALRAEEVVGGAWAQLQPGRTASISPPAVVAGEPASTADRLLDELLQASASGHAQLAQVLLEQDHGADFERLVSRRFEHMTDLLYLVSLASAFPEAESATPLTFEPFSESQQSRLSALVERTYEETRDCPQMNGLRDMADTLAGYRAAGSFDPARWFFLRHDGQDVGCLLLADHPEHRQWELVYVGLVPEFRGRGWGVEVVRHAQFLASRARAKCLLLAVDAANEPAVAMYGEAGFTAWDRRSVLVRRLDPKR
jgi:ribosomal protein S18 acetylase RimI-like enzyme